MPLNKSVSRFDAAIKYVLSENTERLGIGTLGEKLMHRVLKFYIESDPAFHEIPVSGYFADVLRSEEIFEIQTRGFERLVPKLNVLLPKYRITVVYPIIAQKNLIWLDMQSGELTAPKRSPKHGKPCYALPELVRIIDLLDNDNMSVNLLMLKADEYRMLDGWDKTRHKGATKIDKIPTELLDVIRVESLDDIYKLFPSELSEKFSAKDFYKAIGRGGRGAWLTLKILVNKGVLKIVEKKGNAYLYSVKKTVQ